MANRGIPLHLMATFLLFKKQQIQGEGGRLRISHQRSCVLKMILFQTQTSNIDFYSLQMFGQITKKGEFSYYNNSPKYLHETSERIPGILKLSLT